MWPGHPRECGRPLRLPRHHQFARLGPKQPENPRQKPKQRGPKRNPEEMPRHHDIYIYIMEYCVPIFTHARLGWLDALLPPVLTWKETLKISRCCLLHPKKCFFWQRGFAFDIDQFRCCKCGNTILVVWGCRSAMFDATHGRIKSAIASNSLLSSNQERLKTYRVIRTLCKHGTWRASLIGTR